MKKIILGLLVIGSVFTTKATQWDIDVAHSSINFKIEHLGITWVAGSFADFSGMVNSDKEDFSDMSVELSIMANSISTGLADRDKHLNAEDMLNTAKHEKITFKSTKVKAGKNGMMTLEGELNLLGVTAPISLEVKYNGTVKDMYGSTKAGFEVSGMVDRYAHGFKYNAPLENGNMALGQQVHLNGFIELAKK